MLYTTPDLARDLGYHASSIYRAIERLGILPTAQTASGLKLYDEQARDALAEDLDPRRKPAAPAADPSRD